ncbi:MAG TPA: hypothetical protein VNO52_06405, partial [Methylomirabilota bacterium]|nr:hypothetical protein [Methylomirabilota bacterium]
MAFGAVGDGETNDTAAFRSAVNACPAGGRLEIPAGRRFRVGRITLAKNLVVHAHGASLVLAGPEAGFTVEGAITLFRVLGGTVIGTGTP